MGFDAGKPVEIKLFTGLNNFKPLVFNPSKAELEKFGVILKEEPVYSTTAEEGHRKVRIDCWGQGNGLEKLDKVTFFLEDVEKTSQAGNTEFINELGASAWGDSAESLKTKYDWFKGEKIRKAKAGESLLILFIKRWLSISNKDKAELDNIEALLSGNLTQLNDLIKKYPDRKVQVLYTVREYEGNYYQNIYTRYFLGSNSKSTGYWKTHLDGQTNDINYQNSFVFKEFNPLKVEEGGESTSSDTTDSVWGN